VDFSYALIRPLSYIEIWGRADTGSTTNCVVFPLEVIVTLNSKFGGAGLVLIGALSSAGAVAANNTATVLIDNKTTDPAKFTYEQFSGTAKPVFSEVPGNKIGTFVVTSFTDSASGMRFSYSAGAKKCRFVVSHTAPPPYYVPNWKKEATSTGSARAICTVKLEKISTNLPYDYTVRFTVQ